MMVCNIQSTVYKVSYSKVQYVGWDLAIVNTDIIPYKCNWSMFTLGQDTSISEIGCPWKIAVWR